MATEPGVDVALLESVRGFIRDGVSLPLLIQPPPLVFGNTKTVEDNTAAVRERIAEYMAIRAVVRLPPGERPERGIQPLHAVIKPDKKPRLVIDLSRNLNSFLHIPRFRYSSVADAVRSSWPGCWYGKLDLSNAYLSFPLHPDAAPLFTFRFEGDLYRFVNMPFGLATAPLACTQLLAVVAHSIRRRVRHLVVYLDDFLLIAESAEKMRLALEYAQEEFAAFGLVVNAAKTEGPAQSITFLGVVLDSVAGTVACPFSRIEELRSIIRSTLESVFIRRRALESLIGKMSFAAHCLPGARAFMRRLLDLLASARGRRVPVRTDARFRADLEYWLDHLDTWNGRAYWRSARPSPIVLASDASLGGFGFHLVAAPEAVDTGRWPVTLQLGVGHSGSWAREHATICLDHRTISACELFAVYAAAWTWRDQLRNSSALFLVDNSTDVAIINRQATRSPLLACILRALYDLANRYNFDVRAEHLAGDRNYLADFLSRPALHEHNHLHRWASMFPTNLSLLTAVCTVDSRKFEVPGLTSWLQWSRGRLSAGTPRPRTPPSRSTGQRFAPGSMCRSTGRSLSNSWPLSPLCIA
jgi:Reverse transcriptase (RNA-dependent DNA polymerase)